VTQTPDTAASAATADQAETSKGSPSRGTQVALNKMLMSDLKSLAGTLGIKGTTGMRKSALVDAIASAQGSSARGTSPQSSAAQSSGQTSAGRAASSRAGRTESRRTQGSTDAGSKGSNGTASESDAGREPRALDRNKPFAGGQASDDQSGQNGHGSDRSPSQHDDSAQDRSDQAQHAREQQAAAQQSSRGQSGQDQSSRGQSGQGQSGQSQSGQGQSGQGQSSQGHGRSQGAESRSSGQSTSQGRDSQSTQGRDGQLTQSRDSQQGGDRDAQGGSRNSRRRSRSRDRYRDRDKPRAGGSDSEPQVNEDDVLIPAAGILDLLDNYAFVRTAGYLPGPTDVYVSLSMVRKFGLRKGDAITGMVRQSQDSDRREKFNPMVRIDSVNGAEPDAARNRVEFAKLTPLYASDRLRLETEPNQLIGRLIDIVAPVGKGQRGLIVSPSKAGKTIVLQAMANAITTNNPEVHLMVVLVDERPEEVTDMQRAVKGEVIASTFDRPATDHTTVAELAIERAKRLVELGHDVVVLLDSITRLGRAYNLAAPASGRILSGGVDSSALYPPKRFFGAARNIEDGGSLTILATALIETGSKMDEVIFEEFKGTGNMELRLRREYADKRIFPAIDVDASGTRREELLMAKDELQIVWKLRRVLSALEGQQALELLLQKLRQTKSNVEFLMEVNRTTPSVSGLRGSSDDD
jgi:transcription termination factor Rho